MCERLSIRALWVLMVMFLVTIGCGREGRLPTSVNPSDLTSAAANLDTRDERTLETARGRRHRHRPRRVVIAEAREGLSAVLTGEQVYFQKWVTFTNVPDTADFRAALGVHLGELLERWAFSVSGASVTGFLARAEGRNGTDAAGITVTLRYQRGQPVVWSVQRRKPRR